MTPTPCPAHPAPQAPVVRVSCKVHEQLDCTVGVGALEVAAGDEADEGHSTPQQHDALPPLWPEGHGGHGSHGCIGQRHTCSGGSGSAVSMACCRVKSQGGNTG